MNMNNMLISGIFLYGQFQCNVFIELVGSRYNAERHEVSFVSRNTPDKQSNENRCFQLLQASLKESQILAERLLKENPESDDMIAKKTSTGTNVDTSQYKSTTLYS